MMWTMYGISVKKLLPIFDSVNTLCGLWMLYQSWHDDGNLQWNVFILHRVIDGHVVNAFNNKRKMIISPSTHVRLTFICQFMYTIRDNIILLNCGLCYELLTQLNIMNNKTTPKRKTSTTTNLLGTYFFSVKFTCCTKIKWKFVFMKLI